MKLKIPRTEENVTSVYVHVNDFLTEVIDGTEMIWGIIYKIKRIILENIKFKYLKNKYIIPIIIMPIF